MKAGFLALKQICNMINFYKFLKVDANKVEATVNLVNLKSSGQDVLFRIIRSSNYREVDIKIYNLQNDCFPHF